MLGHHMVVEVNRTISKRTNIGACKMITSETISILITSIWVVKNTIQMKMLCSAIRAADITMIMVQIMSTTEIKAIMEVYGHEDLAKKVNNGQFTKYFFVFLLII